MSNRKLNVYDDVTRLLPKDSDGNEGERTKALFGALLIVPRKKMEEALAVEQAKAKAKADAKKLKNASGAVSRVATSRRG